MPLSRSRDYMSIGEVLEALKQDFPDISVSKIRFLESEGLISPERTASGYRKFYPRDVERLRRILTLQRDHFLPLKVIRERLEQGEVDAPAPAPASPPAQAGASPAAAGGDGPVRPQEGSRVPTDVQLDREALKRAAGLDESELRGLEDFGLIDGKAGYYDGDDLAVARAARRLFDYGLEPRHLRLYRQWAEREASFFEQVVAPLARRRDPDGRLQAARSVREMVECSRQIRDAMLRASLRELV